MASSLLTDFVAESCTNPGTSTVNLGGALAGRLPFSSAFQSGSTCYYVITDGTNFEAGTGTFQAGSPPQLARTTVMSNSQGTTARINFTGACTIYCEVPAAAAVTADQFSGGTGWRMDSMGYIENWGTAGTGSGGSVAVTFNKTYVQGAPGSVLLQVTGGSPGTRSPYFQGYTNATTTGMTIFVNDNTGAAASGIGIQWRTIGR